MNEERQHELTSKGNMVVATLVAIYVMIWKPWGFGLLWLPIIPALWFVSSIFVAMPFGILKTALAKKSMIAAGIVDWLNYITLLPVTYYALKWLDSLLHG
jgi:hypothetical protein